MTKPTVYIETTVISYLTARPSRDLIRAAHQKITREWWVESRQVFDLFASDFVMNEVERGDPAAAADRLKIMKAIALLPVSEAAFELAEQLVVALKLPKVARLDASHVAVATVHGMDYLLTWNCRHLANGMLAPKIERTCKAAGYEPPRILTPELLMEAS